MYELMNVHLENGLKVMIHEVPNSKTVSCGLWVKQGSKHENDDTNGLSHLLEHLLITTNNEGSSNNLLDEIAAKGIVYNATTTKEYTSFYFSGIASNLELCLSTLSKIIIDFNDIDEIVLANERKVVEREAIGYYSSFKQIMERSSQALYGNTSIGRIIVGDVENIKKATSEDILNLYTQRYTPENSALVIVGGIDYHNTLKIVNRYFSRWVDKSTVEVEDIVNNEPGVYLNTQSGGESSVISVCFKAPAFNSHIRNSIEITSLILGDGGIKARLAKEIRNKRGLAYVINSYDSFYENRGVLGFACVCNHKSVKEIVKIMINEFTKCKELGFTEEEIEGAKNKLVTKRIIELENVSDHLKFLGRCACYNNIYSLEHEIRNIHKVSSRGLKSVSQDIFNDANMGLAAIGDIDIDEILEVMKFG